MLTQNNKFDIVFPKKGKVKTLPFLEIKNDILGIDYDCTVTFVTAQKAKSLNKKFRGKTYTPNTLSFPYTYHLGEIFLQLDTIYSQTKDFDMPKQKLLLFMYIHSLLHLKGLDHSPKMDKLEQKYLNKWSK